MRIDTWSAINVGDYLPSTYPQAEKKKVRNSAFKKIAFFHEFPLLKAQAGSSNSEKIQELPSAGKVVFPHNTAKSEKAPPTP